MVLQQSQLLERQPEADAEPSAMRRGLRILCSRQLLYVLVGIGIALRLAQYLADRSLWVDEAWLALNLRSHTMLGLTRSLDFAQAAPPGFLFVEHLIARGFGFSEFALRFFPLLCGVVSVVAFAVLARRVLAAVVAPLAVFIFAVSDGLIYYSSEVKPYAVDVAASTLLMLIAQILSQRSPRILVTVALALAGFAAILFSYPSVFLVAAIAAALLINTVFRQRAASAPLSSALPVIAVWALGALVVGVFAVERARQVWSSHGARFLGLEGSNSPVDAANFFGTNLSAAIGFSGDSPFNQLQKVAVAAVLVGVVSLVRRDKVLLCVLATPFLLMFAASGLRLYPLSLRTELFLVPPLVLLLAEGVGALVGWTPRRWQTAVAVALAVAIAGGPAVIAAKGLVHPRHREELRPVLAFVRDHWRRGDTLYVHNYAQYAFLYYERCGCLNLSRDHRPLWPVRQVGGSDESSPAAVSLSPAVLIGKYHGEHWAQYLADVRKLRGRGRVWFVYSHYATPAQGAFIRGPLVGTLNSMGKRQLAIDRANAHAYLYDFR